MVFALSIPQHTARSTHQKKPRQISASRCSDRNASLPKAGGGTRHGIESTDRLHDRRGGGEYVLFEQEAI